MAIHHRIRKTQYLSSITSCSSATCEKLEHVSHYFQIGQCQSRVKRGEHTTCESQNEVTREVKQGAVVNCWSEIGTTCLTVSLRLGEDQDTWYGDARQMYDSDHAP